MCLSQCVSVLACVVISKSIDLCCSVLQCVAVCCSVLQCVAVTGITCHILVMHMLQSVGLFTLLRWIP